MKITKISMIALCMFLLAMALSSCGHSDIKLLEKGKGTWSDWGGSGEYDVTVYSYYVDNPELLRNRIELNMEVDKILESKKNENAVIVVFNQKTPLDYMKNSYYYQLRTAVSIADIGYTKTGESVGNIRIR
ncbi:MAG TPA: hypothetical protein P5107_08085 [Thermotogota bacterium]|nr:hypothetical protein [Thermotogota bacterium]